jgi:hypothetical protein
VESYNLRVKCKERDRLLVAYKTTAKFYALAVRKLEKVRGTTTSKAEYEDLDRLAEDARRKCEISHHELDQHMAVHGCILK